jgi:hypothetical protein
MQHIGGFEHSAGFKLTNEPGNLRTNHAEGIVALPCQHCSCRFELKAGKEWRKKKTTNTCVSIEIHTDLGVPWEEERDGTGQRTPKLHEYVLISNEII